MVRVGGQRAEVMGLGGRSSCVLTVHLAFTLRMGGGGKTSREGVWHMHLVYVQPGS